MEEEQTKRKLGAPYSIITERPRPEDESRMFLQNVALMWSGFKLTLLAFACLAAAFSCLAAAGAFIGLILR